MKLILNEVIEDVDVVKSVEGVFTSIINFRDKKKCSIDYLKIDNVPFDKNYEKVLESVVDLSKCEIEVYYNELESSMLDDELCNMVDLFNMKVSNLGKKFYAEGGRQEWGNLSVFFEEYAELSRKLLEENQDVFLNIVLSINTEVEKLQKPLSKKDTVLIGDCIIWDIIPKLSQLSDTCKKYKGIRES